MSTITWPQNAPEQWNTLTLGGFALPGLVYVDVTSEMEVDVKKAKGARGASTTRQGPNCCQVTIRVHMWEAAHLERFQQLGPLIRPNSRLLSGCAPLPCVHPKLQLHGIDAIQITKIDDKSRDEHGDVYDIVISAIEHRPPVVAKVETVTSKKLAPQENKLAAPPPAKPSTVANKP